MKNGDKQARRVTSVRVDRMDKWLAQGLWFAVNTSHYQQNHHHQTTGIRAQVYTTLVEDELELKSSNIYLILIIYCNSLQSKAIFIIYLTPTYKNK